MKLWSANFSLKDIKAVISKKLIGNINGNSKYPKPIPPPQVFNMLKVISKK
ncbi:MAG: hypothetical protein NTZ59_13470 [Bacteroidetes bacterium]|jgi:hypothetical protein|nr:hypothetical protein [Bacteroidota bacterium]